MITAMRIELICADAVKALGALMITLLHFRPQLAGKITDGISLEEFETVFAFYPHLKLTFLLENSHPHGAAKTQLPFLQRFFELWRNLGDGFLSALAGGVGGEREVRESQ